MGTDDRGMASIEGVTYTHIQRRRKTRKINTVLRESVIWVKGTHFRVFRVFVRWNCRCDSRGTGFDARRFSN